ncbi:MAG: nickel pincer cofactor biosynthesis protein LarC [Gemmatimonadaceae bacterium]
MRIAILDAFSGISGDMTLGALLAVGLEPDWLRALPGRLGLDGVTVEIRDVLRGEIACKKVDFEIPPQPHGRHLRQIRELVARADVPGDVRALADAAFEAIATAEAEIHATTVERVHLHEVGAVDAILDVVGAVWGVRELGVGAVYCGTISLGDGFVEAAHGVLPVPAPATLKLIEGHPVRPGPAGAGELVTPTGAALVRVLSSGPPPDAYVPLRSGFGAGTKDFAKRANALRIVLAELAADSDAAGSVVEQVVQLSADIDDMTPEYLAAVADALRAAGALDVVLVPVAMKKGRAGTRIEVLARPAMAGTLEDRILNETTTIGVRRSRLERRGLPRVRKRVEVLGHEVIIKVVTLPGGRRRAKPEFDDVQRVAQATGRPASDIFQLAIEAGERV